MGFKNYPLPTQFDGGKFAARYKLDPMRGDFSVSDGMLHVVDTVPDDPPIFDPPDLVPQRALDLADLKTKIDLVATTPAIPQPLKDVLIALKKILAIVLLFAATAWSAEPAKEPTEQEIRLRFALAQEMIARRQLEVQALIREAAELAGQIEQIEKKKTQEKKQ